MFMQTTENETVSDLLRDLSPGDPDESEVQDVSEIANVIIDRLFEFSLYVAVAALIIVAIRIMFSRATGNIAAAKESSNGIGWVLGGLVLVLLAPQLVLLVWEAFGGA